MACEQDTSGLWRVCVSMFVQDMSKTSPHIGRIILQTSFEKDVMSFSCDHLCLPALIFLSCFKCIFPPKLKTWSYHLSELL